MTQHQRVVDILIDYSENYFSINKLAEWANVTRKSIRSPISRMKAVGFIKKVRRTRDEGTVFEMPEQHLLLTAHDKMKISNSHRGVIENLAPYPPTEKEVRKRKAADGKKARKRKAIEAWGGSPLPPPLPPLSTAPPAALSEREKYAIACEAQAKEHFRQLDIQSKKIKELESELYNFEEMLANANEKSTEKRGKNSYCYWQYKVKRS